MPSRPCKHPTCTEYVPGHFPTRYCAAHQGEAKEERRERDRSYDRHARNPEAKRFYNSAAWKHVRDAVIAEHPICQRCGADWSRHVHHAIALEDCTPEQRTDREILRALCVPCHNIEEAEQRSAA